MAIRSRLALVPQPSGLGYELDEWERRRASGDRFRSAYV